MTREIKSKRMLFGFELINFEVRVDMFLITEG